MNFYLTRVALIAGVCVPFLYYGSQLTTAPSYPGFTIYGTTASELGSDKSPHAAIFNAGIMVQGAVAVFASFGLFQALRRIGTNIFLSALTAVSLVMVGVQTWWAGYYPLPDPRHGGHPVFIVGMLAVPILLALSLWSKGDIKLRTYLVMTLVLLACMVPIMSGLAGLDTHDYRGLTQRVFTLAVFPPIGVASWVLLSWLARMHRESSVSSEKNTP